MDLIKKIKEAEAQAREIIEQAKAQAADLAEKDRHSRLETLEKAEHERKKTIEAAVADAEKQSLAEIECLRAKAKKTHQELGSSTNAKMAAAVEKVIDYLRG